MLLARHSAYLYGRNTDFGIAEANDNNPIVITDLSHSSLSKNEREQLYAKQRTETVNLLRTRNKHMVLVYPIPEWGARTLITGHDPNFLTRPRAYFNQRQQFIINTLDAILPGDAGITRIKPHELLCNQTSCRVFDKGQPLYQDDDHLSPVGVQYLSPLWASLL